MPLLALFGLFLLVGWKFPSIFKTFYWVFMLPLYTVGPACPLYLIFMAFGYDVPFYICCSLTFIFCAVPFMSWTAPK